MITKSVKNYIKLCNLHKGSTKFYIPDGLLKNASGGFPTYRSETALVHPFAATITMATALETDTSHATNSGLRLRFGTGTTAPTETDYCMESEIANYSIISTVKNNSTYSVGYNEDSTKYVTTLNVDMVLQNTGTEEIQINELGISRGFHSFKGATGITRYDSILLYREVLSETITVAPQGVFSITKTIVIEQETGYEILS